MSKKKIKIAIAVSSSGDWAAYSGGHCGEDLGECHRLGSVLNLVGKKSKIQHFEIEIDFPEILEPPPKGFLNHA